MHLAARACVLLLLVPLLAGPGCAVRQGAAVAASASPEPASMASVAGPFERGAQLAFERHAVRTGTTASGLRARCGDFESLVRSGDDVQGRIAADFARARFGTRLAIVFDSRSAYARTVSGSCRDRFRERGGSVVMEFDLAATPAVQVGAFMVGLQDKADALCVACEPGDVVPVLASIRPVLPSMPIVSGDVFDCDAAATGGRGPTSRLFVTTHAWFGAGAPPEAIAFAEAYRARWNEAPGGPAAQGFDAANAALAALDLSGASGTAHLPRGPLPAKDVWVVEISGGTRALAARMQPTD